MLIIQRQHNRNSSFCVDGKPLLLRRFGLRVHLCAVASGNKANRVSRTPVTAFRLFTLALPKLAGEMLEIDRGQLMGWKYGSI